MRLLDHAQLRTGTLGCSVVTVGNFDGVHLGHRALLGRVTSRARDLGAEAVVYTFHPHPLKVLNPASCPPLLTAFEDRVALLAREGVDVVVRARFDREYAAQEPDAFARSTLAGCLGAREVWVGPDFAFGRGRRGTIDLLRRVGAEVGFAVRVADAFILDGEPVSSTRVRRAVAGADFATTRRLLGRPYQLHGPVVHGAGRGRALGVPTANVLCREECLPAPGVYAAWVRVGSRRVAAALNIGPNPTFGPGELSVEAHLLDFTGDLYGREVAVEPVRRIRGEIAFRSVEDLVAHIHRDVARIRELLLARAEAGCTEGCA